MSNLISALRAALALLISSLGSLASFGLMLAFLWLLNGNGFDNDYKVITLLISASLSIVLAGFILAWITKYQNHVFSAFLGLTIGFLSCSYLLGIRLLVVPLTIFAIALAAGGSYLHQLIMQRKPGPNIILG